MARLNVCLHLSNVALVVGCLLATFWGTLRQFDAARGNLRNLHLVAHQDPSPCGLPLPSTALLDAGVRHDANVFSGIGNEQRTAEDMATAICGSSNTYKALANIMHNTTAHSTMDDDGSWTAAENSLLDALCELDTGKLGDMRVRVSRAYMASHAAFVKFATGCSFASDPFLPAACAQSALVKAELLAAAVDASAGGFGELPSTGQQLYRLVALATSGFFDRFVNAGRCTQLYSPTNASALCEQTFADRAGAVGFDVSVSPPPAAAGSLVGYRNMVQQTCADRAVDFNSPSPPPAPDWLTSETGEMAACMDSLIWGLVDLRRGFGVPDAADPFEEETSALFWLIRPFYKLAFLVDRILEEQRGNRPARLRLYAAYRLAAISAKSMLANSVAGFVFGFASVPLGVMLLTRFLGLAGAKQLVAPPLRSVLPIAALAGGFYWFWSIWVDPEWHGSPYYTSISCGERREAYASSAPWLTSDAGDRNQYSWVPYVILVSVGYLFVYVAVLRKFGVSQAEWASTVRYTNPQHPYALMLTIMVVVQLTFLVLNAVSTGTLWFDDAVKQEVTESLPIGKLENYENDLYLAVVSSLMYGFAIGASTQRWAAATMSKAGKIPYGLALLVPVVTPTLLLWYVYAEETAEEGTQRKTYAITNAILTLATVAVLFYFVKQLFDAPEPVAKDVAPVVVEATVAPPPPASLQRSNAMASFPPVASVPPVAQARWQRARAWGSDAYGRAFGTRGTRSAMPNEQLLPLLNFK